MDNFDNFDDGDVDPAAEFLAREQTQLAGLEDDLNTANVPIGVTQTLSNGKPRTFNQFIIVDTCLLCKASFLTFLFFFLHVLHFMYD